MVIHWNLDLKKGQGSGKTCSLYQAFVIQRFFSIHFTITWVNKIVRYNKDFVIFRYIDIEVQLLNRANKYMYFHTFEKFMVTSNLAAM